MQQITLPANGSLNSCNALFDKLVNTDECKEITINFGHTSFYDIASIVALLARLHAFVQSGLSVNIQDHTYARPFAYMQRMNFFKICGIDIDENFTRHESAGRFVEIKVIGKGRRTDTGKLSEEIADCIAPEQKDLIDPEQTGFYDGVLYSVSELINNVIQHSNSYGFLGAQHYQKDNLTQIVVADTGMGIMQSFIQSNSPHSSKATSDRAAIELALKAEVSSKTHGIYALNGSENAGVGLTLLKDIALSSGGSFLVISGNACFKNNEWITLKNSYQGTFVACSFKRSNLDNFNQLLENAKVKNGLRMGDTSVFSEMFKQ